MALRESCGECYILWGVRIIMVEVHTAMLGSVVVVLGVCVCTRVRCRLHFVASVVQPVTSSSAGCDLWLGRWCHWICVLNNYVALHVDESVNSGTGYFLYELVS